MDAVAVDCSDSRAALRAPVVFHTNCIRSAPPVCSFVCALVTHTEPRRREAPSFLDTGFFCLLPLFVASPRPSPSRPVHGRLCPPQFTRFAPTLSAAQATSILEQAVARAQKAGISNATVCGIRNKVRAGSDASCPVPSMRSTPFRPATRRPTTTWPCGATSWRWGTLWRC